MTPDEQDCLISKMVKERNALRRERTLLNEQISRTQQGMNDASGAANLMNQGDYTRLERGFDYQDTEAFVGTLRRWRTVTERLTELTERLDACC